MGSVDTPGFAFAVKKVGNFAYVADMTEGLQIIDVSIPTAPSIVGGVNTPGDARGVALTGHFAIVVDHSLRVVDLSEPSSPIIIGTLDFPFGGIGLDVEVQGNHAFVAGHEVLYVVDISNPVLPSLVAEAGVAGTADDIAIAGIYAYLASSQAGLQVVDISIPTSPVSIGGIDTADNARGVSATGNLAIVASSFSGLWVFPAQCATTASVSDPNAAPAFVIVQNHPNPFSEFTTFQYQLPTTNQVDLRIYDIGGRLVRVLEANAHKESGEHVTRWDGRDGQGRRLPAGVYLSRIEAGIHSGSRRVVLLK